MKILPKVIRLRDAPAYLGMNKNYFNQSVRCYFTELKIGERGIGFDRLDLDQWVEYTKVVSGRPPTKRRKVWDAKTIQPCLDSSTLKRTNARVIPFTRKVKDADGNISPTITVPESFGDYHKITTVKLKMIGKTT